MTYYEDDDNYRDAGVSSAKRVGLNLAPWMGDWFVGISPRNGNGHTEGHWSHWMQVALSILQHPATAEQRPEVYEAVKNLKNTDYYDDGPMFEADDIARLWPKNEYN